MRFSPGPISAPGSIYTTGPALSQVHVGGDAYGILVIHRHVLRPPGRAPARDVEDSAAGSGFRFSQFGYYVIFRITGRGLAALSETPEPTLTRAEQPSPTPPT